MDAERWKLIDQIIDEAMDMPVGERDAFVSERTGEDRELYSAVIELLHAQEFDDSFLQESAMHLAAKVMANEKTEVSNFAFVNKKISKYQVEKLIGAGGMGEVYLAFDEKLKRRVALKLLPREFGSNDERVKRFEVEARAIALLNHPGIVTIFDVGSFEGVNFIATEYVEGKTLRELIGEKHKARNIILNSIQICDALSAAHEKGIIHRDIKPENIMIRNDGYAKILDFGLAKLTDPGQNTLRDMSATTKGVIIGTPAYMSPAQISDERVDHRTDLWSCGVVLYEFLTGINPFKKASRKETFEAILSHNPEPCRNLNSNIPQELEAIISKLLEKDPALGYQTAADLRADLKRVKRDVDSIQSHRTDPQQSVQTTSFTPKWSASPAFIGFVTLLAGILAITVYLFASRFNSPVGTDWAVAKHVQITNEVGVEFFPNLSPDGDDIVYSAQGERSYDIFIQGVGSKNRINLTADSDSDDTQPAFSPDGKMIAFRSERESPGIYTIDTSGGNLKRVSDIGYHPSWSPDGTRLVVSTFGRSQPTVRASAGMKLIEIDVASGAKTDLLHAEASFPTWSPNGHRIAYWFYTGTFGRRDIATIPANGGDPVIVAENFAVSNWNPVWSPDGKFLYFVSSKAGNMNFWRVAIDEKTGRALSDPEPVTTASTFSRHPSFSRDGKRMAYVQTYDRSNIQGIEFDERSGKAVGEPFWITQGDREIARAELNSSGERFVMRIVKRTQDDIVTVSRNGTDWRDVTNDEPFDRYVRWSPDGKRLAYYSDRSGGGQVWVSNDDGTGAIQVTNNPDTHFATAFPTWSPDGERLAVNHNTTTFIINAGKTFDLQTPTALPAMENDSRFVPWDWSKDGKVLAGVITSGSERWIGYYSFENEKYELVAKIRNSIPSMLPDSRRTVYADGNTIFIADIFTKKVAPIFSSDLADIYAPFVSSDGKLLYYTAANHESDIWMLDLSEQ